MQAKAIITHQTKTSVILLALAVVLVMTFFIALSIGQVTIPIKDIFIILFKKVGLFSTYETNSVYETVLWSIRLPRLITTVLIGAALAISGAALQGLFRNPLVEPGLIGVSSGAALAVVTLIVFGSSFSLSEGSLGMNFLMPAFAFGGGLIATMVVMKIGSQVGKTNIAVLILAGVAVNAFAGALMGLVIFHADENELRMFTFWTLGDLSGSSWVNLLVAAPLLILSSLWLLTFQHPLNAIAIGEAEAFHMGVDVEKVKKSIVFFSALAVGISVSLAGIIGFIGLVVPHLIRVTFQSDNRLVMPASLLGGPLLLLLADLASRTLDAPSELPIGVVTALVGAPLLHLLIIEGEKEKRTRNLMISAKNISLLINGRKLLNEVNLEVIPGSFTAIAGPNGAGKTSLLKVLSGESTRYEGIVEINGTPSKKYSVADLSKVRAVLPQSSHLQFPFSVQQIVEMGRQHFSTTAIQNKKVIEEVMELTDIKGWSERNYLSLSGGEQQRVQLTRVMAQVWETKSYPRYILLDEPTSSLDIAQQQMIFTLVKQACERNIGVLAIVHDLNQVAQFADKLYFLKEGRVVAQGNPKEVFTKSIIEETFCCRVNVYHDPCTDCPYIVPDRNIFPSLKTAIV